MRFILKLFEYKKWQLILFLILLGITIGISGYYINSLSEQSLRKEKNNELRSISELKINQILLWKKERLGNAEIISKIPFIKNSIQQLNTKPYNDEQQKVYRDFFKSLVNYTDFDNILVASIDGKLLFSFDSSVTNIDPPTSAYIYRSVKKDSTVFSELYRNSLTKKIALDIITPIHSQVGKIIGVIVFQINPDHYLYPLIQTWPTESKTAETLVIRNDIDSVLFINDIRFHKNAALNLRIPLSKTDVPAVQAALGHKGIWEGKDYRNANVLSFVSPIPGTQWFIIAKVDKDEIFSELYAREFFIAIITFVFIILLTGVIILIINLHQKNTYKKLYQSEKSLHSVENEFRTTLYSIGDGVITTDKNGTIKQMNNVAERLTRWPEPDAVGKQLYEVFTIISENKNFIIDNSFEKVIKTGIATNIENHTVLISKGGREIPILSNASPIKNEDGDISGVILVFKDQTKERIAQRKLAESEEKFRNLFAHLLDIVCVISSDSTIISGNPAIESVTGWETSDWIDKSFTSFVHPEDLPAAMEKFERVLKGNNELSFEVRLLCKSGNYIFGEMNASLLKINDKISGSLCIIRDTTERKKAEKLISASEIRYRRLFESAKDGILILDAQTGIIVDVNPFLVNLLGYSKEKFLKKEIWEIGSFNDIVANKEKFLELQRKKYVRYENLPLETADGKKINVEFISNAYSVGQREVIQCNIRDITERKRSEDKLRENEKILKEAQKIAMLGIYIFDLRSGKWQSSEILDTIFGIEPDFDKSIDSWVSIIHPDWQKVMADYFANEVLGQKKNFNKIYKIIRKNDKAERWVSGLGDLVFNDKNEIIRMVGTIKDITDIKNAERNLLEKEYFLNQAQRMGHIGTWSWDLKGPINLSDETYRIYGVTKDTFIPTTENLIDLIHPGDRSLSQKWLEDCVAGKSPGSLEFRILHPDGTIHIISSSGNKIPSFDKDGYYIAGTIQDITERKKGEEKILSLNRVYLVRSCVNKMIIKARQVEELFNEACEIAVSKSNYSMAWIGIFDQKNNTVKPVAWNSDAEDYLKDLIISLDKKNGNLGTAGIAVLENHYVINNNIGLDESLGARSSKALEMNLQSAASFPLEHSLQIYGVINFYSKNKNHFDENEIALLSELADDISFSIYSIEQEKLRKQSEDELRKLSLAIEQSPVSVVITNSKGIIEYVNDRLCVVSGYTKEEILGSNPRILKSGLQDKKYYKNLWDTILSGNEWKGELQNKKKNGNLYWESVLISPLVNNGEITHFIAIKEDITDLIEKESKLMKSEKRYKELFEKMLDGVYKSSHEGKFLQVNDALVKMLGYDSMEELCEIDIKTQLYFQESDRESAALEEKREEMAIFRIKKKDGSEIWVEDHGRHVTDDKGNVIYHEGVMRDVTERLRTKKELIKAKEKAEEMNRLKSSFLSNMSHELRTPLIGILGYAEFLQGELKDKELLEMANIIKTSGMRLNKTLNNILDISKIEAENTKIDFIEMDLFDFLNEQIKLFRKPAEDKNLDFNFETKEKTLFAYVDEGLFTSIIGNLLNNAIKFTDTGSINLYARKEDDYIVIEVKDTGIGVREEMQNLIFEPFRQASEGYSRKFEGTGLGLSLVKKYTDLMNGTITLKSKLGEGSTFTLRLPGNKIVSEKFIETNWE